MRRRISPSTRLRLVAFGGQKFLVESRAIEFRNRQDPPPWREQSFDTGFPLAERMDFIRRSTRSMTVPRRPQRAATTLPRTPGSNRQSLEPDIDAISTM